MANQNLSQFGENTSVSDADYTFVWDSAASISKKVSRNSWLNSGTLTSDAPVTISQTWGNNLVAFTALKVNAAGTSDANSAPASNFLELQVNGTTRFKIDKLAHLFISNPNSRFDININNIPVAAFFAGGLMRTYGSLGFSDPTTFPNDLILTRDGAGQLALRNSANAQTFRVYNTYTDASNYERASLNWASNVFKISTEKLGGGADRGMEINAGVYLNINIGGSLKFGMGGAGTSIYTPLGFGPDNTHDIGASGANRPRNLYVGSNILAAGNVGIGTTSPTSKLHVAGNSSPSITVDNTLATGASQLLFKNTVVTGDTDGIFLNGSAQAGFGGNGSLNIKATTGPIAFHTASVTNALSIAQSGAITYTSSVLSASGSSGTLGAAGIERTYINQNGLRIFGFDSGLFLLGAAYSSANPALKRNGTEIQARLADDLAFTFIQGKLKTDTAFTATTVTPTGFITLYDSTGTAYKVPCVPA